VFVLPSRSEPFGIAIIEAMACEKPVISTKVGGIPEIIEHGRNGILIEPDDPKALTEALIMLIKDPELRFRLARNGYATVHKQFSSRNTGSTYEGVFEGLLEQCSQKVA